MGSIFYDLETSDLNRVGQILNFAFVAVNDELEVVDTLSANVKISRLQLPRAGAICANRIDVIKHQKESQLSEFEAVRVINRFFEVHAPKYREAPVSLIGYNSQSFDLPYLRTVFVRNGVHPYPRGFAHRDLFLVARKLLITNDRFRKMICRTPPGVKEWMPNLRLELIAQQLGLLEGEQTHESLADVHLSIRLAKYFREEFEEDVTSFEPYQVRHLHRLTRGTPVQLREPMKKEFSFEHFEKSFPAVLLDSNERYALWIRLDRFAHEQESGEFNRSSILWRKFQEHVLLSGELILEHEEQMKVLAEQALERYRSVTLQGYFEDKECDIEQFIYRLPIDEFPRLFEAIKERNPTAKLSADGRQIAKRSWLERWQPADGSEEEFRKSFRDYARYRYGGKLVLSRDSRGDEDRVIYHPTLKELYQEIGREKEARGEVCAEILSQLETYYRHSEISEVAGEELLS